MQRPRSSTPISPTLMKSSVPETISSHHIIAVHRAYLLPLHILQHAVAPTHSPTCLEVQICFGVVDSCSLTPCLPGLYLLCLKPRFGRPQVPGAWVSICLLGALTTVSRPSALYHIVLTTLCATLHVRNRLDGSCCGRDVPETTTRVGCLSRRVSNRQSLRQHPANRDEVRRSRRDIPCTGRYASCSQASGKNRAPPEVTKTHFTRAIPRGWTPTELPLTTE